MDIVGESGWESDSPEPHRPRRDRGFAMVFEEDLDHPVFRGRSGGTTLKVWARVSRWALTDGRSATAERPVGHVVVPEARLAKVLGLGDDTVRRALRRLEAAGRLTLWREPVRGQVHQRPDGQWAGLSKEFIVVPLADEVTLKDAEARKAARAAQKADRESHKRVQQVEQRDRAGRVRGIDGRFRRSHHVSTVSVTSLPTEAGTSVPTEDGTSAYETLVSETLEDETQEAQSCAFGKNTPQAQTMGNRVAFIALREAERQNQLPALRGDGQRAGIAYVLTAQCGDDRRQIHYTIAEAAPAMWDGEPADTAFAYALGLDPSEYWDLIEAMKQEWAACRSDVLRTTS